MALTEYDYTISTAFPNQEVNSTRLTLEIADSAIAETLSHIDTNEASDNCAIWFENALTQDDKTALDGIVAVHSGQSFPNRKQVYQVSAETSAEATSSADVLVPGMTITPGPGNYLVSFTGSTENSLGNKTNFFSVYVNGTKIDYSQRRFKRGSNQGDVGAEVSIKIYVKDVGIDETIEIRWRVNGGTGTIYERNLVVELMAEENIS